MIAAIAMRATRNLGKGSISLIGVLISVAIASNVIQMLMVVLSLRFFPVFKVTTRFARQ